VIDSGIACTSNLTLSPVDGMAAAVGRMVFALHNDMQYSVCETSPRILKAGNLTEVESYVFSEVSGMVMLLPIVC
jgi:hypothetical protein